MYNNCKGIRIGLFFTNIDRDYNKVAASTWIRILQMVKHYRNLGCEVYINDYFKTYDVAVLFRKSKRKYYYILRYLKMISGKVYFDTCINIFEENEEISSERAEYAKKIGKHSNGIITASHYLADVAIKYSASTFTMEDALDLNHFNATKVNVNLVNPVFGWSGVPHKAHFLNKYQKSIDDNIILITLNNDYDFSKLKFRFKLVEWNYETFPNELLKIDVALLPRVTNDHYNQGHSSFKALVFAGLGIPVIANKIPSYVKLSKYYNGIVFLEDYNDSIAECLQVLRSRDLSVNKVRAHYSCENQARALVKYFCSKANEELHK